MPADTAGALPPLPPATLPHAAQVTQHQCASASAAAAAAGPPLSAEEADLLHYADLPLGGGQPRCAGPQHKQCGAGQPAFVGGATATAAAFCTATWNCAHQERSHWQLWRWGQVGLTISAFSRGSNSSRAASAAAAWRHRLVSECACLQCLPAGPCQQDGARCMLACMHVHLMHPLCVCLAARRCL